MLQLPTMGIDPDDEWDIPVSTYGKFWILYRSQESRKTEEIQHRQIPKFWDPQWDAQINNRKEAKRHELPQKEIVRAFSHLELIISDHGQEARTITTAVWTTWSLWLFTYPTRNTDAKLLAWIMEMTHSKHSSQKEKRIDRKTSKKNENKTKKGHRNLFADILES